MAGAGNWYSRYLTNPTLTIDPLGLQYVQNSPYTGAGSDSVGLAQDVAQYMFPVRAVTPVNLVATYANGAAGVGATLTNNSTQLHLSLDGALLNVNDRVLVCEQNTKLQNGIYVVTNPGSVSTNWVLTRASDWNKAVQMRPGRGVPVAEGDNLGGSIYVMGNPQPVVVGTDPLTFDSMFLSALHELQDYLALSGGTLTGDLILDGPATQPNQAVTYTQLQSVAAGLVVKQAVTAASTANLTAVYANGAAGVGATLTNSGVQAAFSIDGVTPAINSRILIKDQTASEDNGIYVLTTVGTGATNWVLTRSTDYDQAAEIMPGTLVVVNSGTVNANTSWIQTDTVTTVGTDPIQFTQFTANPATFLKVSNNLSDVASKPTSRTNLGVAIGSDVEAWSAILDTVAAGTYTGSTSITTLGTITSGTWHGSVLSGTYGGTGVNNGASTITLAGNVNLAGSFTTAGAFAVTQTYTGITNVTFPTSGTLATTSQIPTGAALTKTDDTNVTLSLGGSPSTALVNAASLTLGWTGQLSVARGGTGLAAATIHNLLIGNGTTALTLLAPSATSGVPLISQGSTSDPAYGTVVVAGGGTGLVSLTTHNLIIGNGTSAATLLAPSATSGVALISQGASADPAYGTVVVAGGGTNITTYTLGDTLYSSATNVLSKLAGNTTAVKQYLSQTGDGVNSAAPVWATISGGDITGAALTKGNDTNVTLTLAGTPATALLRAASITAGWTGQLAETRGGTAQSTYATGDILYASAANTLSKLTGNITTTKNFLVQTGLGSASQAPAWGTITAADVPGSALTVGSDTNVTLTLGGTPSTALLAAASVTAGWTGQLSLARGGSNADLSAAASLGGIVYSTATAMAILAGTSTARQMLQSGSSAAPVWSTATWPATTTANQLLYSSANNTVVGLGVTNNAALSANATGVPTWLALTDGQFVIGSSTGAPAAATISAGNNTSVSVGHNTVTVGTTVSGSLLTRYNVQTFTATGAFTYTPTAGTSYAKVTLVGAGAASGGCVTSASTVAAGAGGGAGGMAQFILSAANIGVNLTGSVGTGGTVGTAGNHPGNNGGNTTLATTSAWTCAGGSGGGGMTGVSTVGVTVAGGGGVGGTVTTGTGTIVVSSTGQAGQQGYMFISGTGGAGLPIGGAGGSVELGYGTGGIALHISGNGIAGVGYGAGASGSGSITENTSRTGTAGQNGVAIFEEFIAA